MRRQCISHTFYITNITRLSHLLDFRQSIPTTTVQCTHNYTNFITSICKLLAKTSTLIICCLYDTITYIIACNQIKLIRAKLASNLFHFRFWAERTIRRIFIIIFFLNNFSTRKCYPIMKYMCAWSIKHL